MKTSNQDSLYCSICKCLFRNKSQVINHNIIKHDSVLKYKACPDCDFKTFSPCNLMKHIRRQHEPQKRFKCTICGVQYVVTATLKRHLEKYAGKQPLKCKECDAQFHDSRTLEIHVTRTHSTERRFKCNTCGLRSQTRRCLKIHERIHTGDKTFVCTDCNDKFYDSWSLLRHERVHTGEKPFICTHCDARFHTRESLKRHMKAYYNKQLLKIRGARRVSDKPSKM